MGMALCVPPENNVVTHRLHIHHPPGEREVVPLTGVLHSSSSPSEESRGQVGRPGEVGMALRPQCSRESAGTGQLLSRGVSAGCRVCTWQVFRVGCHF